MKRTYDIVFVTNVPSFYKIRLCNGIAEKKSVFAVFLDSNSAGRRNKDFVSVKPSFDHRILFGSYFRKVFEIVRILLSLRYGRLLISGWENFAMILPAFVSPKRKNAAICESSIYEYVKHPLRDFVKRAFLKRMSVVYPAGLAQERLIRHLGYNGICRNSGGCGLLNYCEQPQFVPKSEVKSFLYVGRLSEEKNLELLVSVFNGLPELRLNIIGFGPCEGRLKAMSKANIRFLGAVDNLKLPEYYRNNDVFILPSVSEPWGLVVEEALNNGLPVIVSDKVGCRDDLVSGRTGLVFTHNSEKDLKEKIECILDVDRYNSLRKAVSEMNFGKRSEHQLDTFCAL